MDAGNKQESLRLRVFAGPNGSGKSTIIHAVRDTTINNRPIDFGYYINADDIARSLGEGGVDIESYDVPIDNQGFCTFAAASGLLNDDFTLADLQSCFSIVDNKVQAQDTTRVEQLAQLIARYLREQMLESGKRFSFEIESRYYRSLTLLHEASQIAYQAYFFDNSMDDSPFQLVAHFKMVDGKQVWDEQGGAPPKWFDKYYLSMEESN